MLGLCCQLSESLLKYKFMQYEILGDVGTGRDLSIRY